MRITESQLRRIIREELLDETYQGFVDRTTNLAYERLPFAGDFDVDKAAKPKSREMKRIWNEEADHKFMDSLVKVHWINDRTSNGFEGIIEAMKRFLSVSGNNEVSTSAYLPGERIESVWGTYGVIVKGRTTLAVNNMDDMYTGHHGKAPEEAKKKYGSSGMRKRPFFFQDKFARGYVLDRESFEPKLSHRSEFIVGNWKPVAIIQTRHAARDISDSLRERVKNLTKIEDEHVTSGRIPRRKFNYMLTCKQITLDMATSMSEKELDAFYSKNCREHIRPDDDSILSINHYENLKRVVMGSPELEQFGLPVVDADLQRIGSPAADGHK